MEDLVLQLTENTSLFEVILIVVLGLIFYFKLKDNTDQKIDKLETTLNNRIDKLEFRIDKLDDRIDKVETKNLNRQFYFLDQIGQHKTKALEKNLKRINPKNAEKYKRTDLSSDGTSCSCR